MKTTGRQVGTWVAFLVVMGMTGCSTKSAYDPNGENSSASGSGAMVCQPGTGGSGSDTDDTRTGTGPSACVPQGSNPDGPGSGVSGDDTAQSGQGPSHPGNAPDDTGSHPNPTNPADPSSAICQQLALDLTGQAVSPNVMLAVDVSNSMNSPINAVSLRSKIDDTKSAILALLTKWEGKVRFGWMHFPMFGTCTPGTISLECDNNNTGTLRTIVPFLIPNGGTPTGDSLKNLLASSSLRDATRTNFVILLTDGVPTCPTGNGQPQANGQPLPADEDLAVSAVRNLRTAKVDTFVIGIGEDLNNTSPAALNRMAIEGGRARAGTARYYQANSVDQLNATLGSVIGMVISCNHILPVRPASADQVEVLLDGQPLARDILHQNGFDYDLLRNQLTFYGPTCDSLQTGQVKKAEVKINC